MKLIQIHGSMYSLRHSRYVADPLHIRVRRSPAMPPPYQVRETDGKPSQKE